MLFEIIELKNSNNKCDLCQATHEKINFITNNSTVSIFLCTKCKKRFSLFLAQDCFEYLLSDGGLVLKTGTIIDN